MISSAPYDGLVLVVEDDAFMRDAVSEYLANLGFEVSAARTYNEGITKLNAEVERLHLLVVDLALPEASEADSAQRLPLGIEIVRQAKRKKPELGVVILSAYGHLLPELMHLVKSGYRGFAYVAKGSKATTFRYAISQVIAGDIYLQPSVFGKHAAILESRFLSLLDAETAKIVVHVAGRIETLSPQQKRIVELFTRSPDAIAREMELNLKTIRNYHDNIYDRLGLKEDSLGAS